MPIYEFVCADCDHEFESLQRLNDPPPGACPNCGSAAISKKLSAAGFRLKGGGWYETDFKNKKPASGGSEAAAKADATPKTGGDAANSESGSKETKLAAGTSDTSGGSATSSGSSE